MHIFKEIRYKILFLCDLVKSEVFSAEKISSYTSFNKKICNTLHTVMHITAHMTQPGFLKSSHPTGPSSL